MKQSKMTTPGWQSYIQRKDVSKYSVALKDIKQSNPVELAYYAKRLKIDDDPVFAWWVPYVQKKREIILSKVKSKCFQRLYKYEVWLRKSVKEAYALYEKNMNYQWRKGIEEEMAKKSSRLMVNLS